MQHSITIYLSSLILIRKTIGNRIRKFIIVSTISNSAAAPNSIGIVWFKRQMKVAETTENFEAPSPTTFLPLCCLESEECLVKSQKVIGRWVLVE